jgi:hypothetical protein
MRVMSDPVWQYANADNTIVWREWPDGRQESCLVSVIQDWIDAGNTPNPYVPPLAPKEPTPQEKLAAAGLSVDELKTLLGIK